MKLILVGKSLASLGREDYCDVEMLSEVVISAEEFSCLLLFECFFFHILLSSACLNFFLCFPWLIGICVAVTPTLIFYHMNDSYRLTAPLVIIQVYSDKTAYAAWTKEDIIIVRVHNHWKMKGVFRSEITRSVFTYESHCCSISFIHTFISIKRAKKESPARWLICLLIEEGDWTNQCKECSMLVERVFMVCSLKEDSKLGASLVRTLPHIIAWGIIVASNEAPSIGALDPGTL